MHNINNINISSIDEILTPDTLKSRYPMAESDTDFVYASRKTIENILSGLDKRLMVIVGPCSIHDTKAALEYASKLKALSEQIKDKVFIVMRVYFEKPRTTVGWKGLINDPHLDDTFELEEGLEIARKLMLDVTRLGLPIGTEALDPISPQYLSDLVSWSAIGARTTESQTHRELASGLSSPVGFKNGTDGSIEVAINAMLSAKSPHSFLGVNADGKVAIVNTKGNNFGHVILRGGTSGPNHDSVSVSLAQELLQKANLPQNILVDCSHGNSHKNHKLQTAVLADVVQQIKNGNTSLKGVMIESNLFEGNQKFTPSKKEDLKYGVSITDACIDWNETEHVLTEIATKL